MADESATGNFPEAREVVRAGHDLVNAVFERLSPSDQAKWREFELAGAEAALTVKWSAGEKVEIRLGFVLDDGPSQTVFALNLTKTH